MCAEAFVGGLFLRLGLGIYQDAFVMHSFQQRCHAGKFGKRQYGPDHVDHAMVGGDDQIDGQMQSAKALRELSHESVDVVYGLVELGGIYAEVMPGMISVSEVKGDEVRAFGGRKLQPGDDLVDALLAVILVEVISPEGGPTSGDLSVGARPEHGCGAHAILFRE